MRTTEDRKKTSRNVARNQQSFRELQKTPRIRENFGRKSPREAPPNEWSEVRRTDNKSREEITNNIIPSDNSGYPPCMSYGTQASSHRNDKKIFWPLWSLLQKRSETSKDKRTLKIGADPSSDCPDHTWPRIQRKQISKVLRYIL